VRATRTPCPRCGAPVHVHEIAFRSKLKPAEPPQWLVGRRFCSDGCILLTSDLEGLEAEETPED
jgi:endogenous inhibitor of DNA gyrase (YacG/DUF329 family)